MKRSFSFAFFFIAVFLLRYSVSPVQAHMLKTDTTIGAVIHIDPDDDPYVGVPSDIFFELKDTTGRFRPENCNCVVSIKQDDKVLDSFPLSGHDHATDLSHAAATYTFPQKGIYTITLDGSPVTGGTFQTFSISYDVRVARIAAAAPKPNSNAPLYIFASFLGLAIVCMIVWFLISNKKKSKGLYEKNTQ
ncbi:MAG: hypothetical protein ABI758_00205 [Candidatus Woesebacteria bacterium]